MIALIDADSIMFQSCFNVDTPDAAFAKFDDLIETCMIQTFCDDMKIAIKGDGNFRYELTDSYKEHRPSLPEPVEKYLPAVREHALKMGAVPADGMEADDLVTHWAYEQAYEDCVVCHLDKDLDMIPGEHFNFHWNKMCHYSVSVLEADSWFHQQLLMGDRADNIKCLDGIGPVKAKKIIEAADADKRIDMVMDLWSRRYGKGWQDALLIAGNLLWMRRFPGDKFTFEHEGVKYEPAV